MPYIFSYKKTRNYHDCNYLENISFKSFDLNIEMTLVLFSSILAEMYRINNNCQMDFSFFRVGDASISVLGADRKRKFS